MMSGSIDSFQSDGVGLPTVLRLGSDRGELGEKTSTSILLIEDDSYQIFQQLIQIYVEGEARRTVARRA